MNTGTRHGLGQHEQGLDNKDVEVRDTLVLVWAGQLIYYFAISFAKFSIISSYLRMLPYQRLHQACWVVLGLTAGFLVASGLASIFICSPVESAWNPALRTPTSCYRFVDLIDASAIFNMTTDLILCTLPLPYFLRLKIPLKQKISASCLSMAGGL